MTTPRKPSLAERLARAQSTSQRRHAAMDNLNAEIQSLEKKLTKVNLGVTAAVSFDLDSEEIIAGHFRNLHFTKNGNEWCFMVVDGREFNDDLVINSQTPLVRASMATRLEAARLLPKLLEALIVRAEQDVEEITEAIEVIRDVALTVDTVNNDSSLERLRRLSQQVPPLPLASIMDRKDGGK